MIYMAPAARTELLDLDPLRLGLLILGGRVILLLALNTLKRNDLARHDSALNSFSTAAGAPGRYSIISVTVPAPTVRPPSRMAKRNPLSIATGVINSTARFTLSPGITISVPDGSSTTPVTSVVRK